MAALSARLARCMVTHVFAIAVILYNEQCYCSISESRGRSSQNNPQRSLPGGAAPDAQELGLKAAWAVVMYELCMSY